MHLLPRSVVAQEQTAVPIEPEPIRHRSRRQRQGLEAQLAIGRVRRNPRTTITDHPQIAPRVDRKLTRLRHGEFAKQGHRVHVHHFDRVERRVGNVEPFPARRGASWDERVIVGRFTECEHILEPGFAPREWRMLAVSGVTAHAEIADWFFPQCLASPGFGLVLESTGVSIKEVALSGRDSESPAHVGIWQPADDLAVLVEPDLAAAFVPETANCDCAVGQDLHRLGEILNPLRPAAKRVANPGGCVAERLRSRLGLLVVALAHGYHRNEHDDRVQHDLKLP